MHFFSAAGGRGGGEDACWGLAMGYEIRMNNKDAEGRSKMGFFSDLYEISVLFFSRKSF